MNPFRFKSRGHLSGHDVDTLVRWGLHASVEGAEPPAGVWERIEAATRAQASADGGRSRRAALTGALLGAPLAGLGLLVRVIFSSVPDESRVMLVERSGVFSARAERVALLMPLGFGLAPGQPIL